MWLSPKHNRKSPFLGISKIWCCNHTLCANLFRAETGRMNQPRHRLAEPRRTPKKNVLSFLEEIGRAQIRKARNIFLWCRREKRGGGGAASFVGVLRKMGSDFFKQTPPSFTFCEIVRNCLGAKRLGMVFFRNLKGIFEIARQRAVGNAEVRTNLFEKIPNPFGIFLLSVFFGLVGVF